MSISYPTSPPDNLADVLLMLGEVDPARVIATPPPGAATEEDLLRLLDGEPKRLCELIDGILVEKAMGFQESTLAAYLTALLVVHVRDKNLGLVAGADGPWRLNPRRVRLPDIAFIGWDRLPGRKQPTTPIIDTPPDLAIEVLSPSNRPGEMLAKRRDFFAAGVSLVWEIDPRARTVSVYTGPETAECNLSGEDTLSAPGLLSNFSLKLSELFSELDRHG
ncbi:MAG: Uma2 family endonuclease [Planctomycetales bacterium]|nr:Uma2 family endonuclease [Planctomycetales bacterium]